MGLHLENEVKTPTIIFNNPVLKTGLRPVTYSYGWLECRPVGLEVISNVRDRPQYSVHASFLIKVGNVYSF